MVTLDTVKYTKFICNACLYESDLTLKELFKTKLFAVNYLDAANMTDGFTITEILRTHKDNYDEKIRTEIQNLTEPIKAEGI
jgi:hypothetical protein